MFINTLQLRILSAVINASHYFCCVPIYIMQSNARKQIKIQKLSQERCKNLTMVCMKLTASLNFERDVL